MRGLYRSRQRVLTGVAAGLGERFGINPILLRVAWFCSIPFTFGLSVLAYVVLAVVVPVAPEGHVAAGRPALVPQAFAAFILAHGLIHVIGFLPAWHLPAPKGFDSTTLAFYGQVDLGDGGAKALGLAWLAATVAYVAAAILLWRGSRHAVLVTALASVASAAICAISLPMAQAGLVIDVALIAIVLVAPRLVVARPAATSLSAAADR
jgi:phage shock protein C